MILIDDSDDDDNGDKDDDDRDDDDSDDDAPLLSLLQVYPPSSGPSLAANPTILRTSPS
jgi:hypothetical protein